MSSHRAHAITTASSVILLLAVSMAGQGVVAQTTATQGSPEPGPENDVTVFQSPMILEIPLEPFESLLQKKWVPIEDVPRYRCEGVSLQRVRVRGTRGKAGEGIGLDVRLETYTVPGKDKWADLRVDLVLDGAILDGELIRVNAEEDTTRRVSSYLEIPADRTGSPDKPVLKITVTVSDN